MSRTVLWFGLAALTIDGPAHAEPQGPRVVPLVSLNGSELQGSWLNQVDPQGAVNAVGVVRPPPPVLGVALAAEGTTPLPAGSQND